MLSFSEPHSDTNLINHSCLSGALINPPAHPVPNAAHAARCSRLERARWLTVRPGVRIVSCLRFAGGARLHPAPPSGG